MPAQPSARGGAVSRSAALVAAVIALVAGPVGMGSASASQGSVPAVVAAYAADPHGLIARLDDLFGGGANGTGLVLGSDTTVGQLDRVFVWREDFLAGATGSSPIKLTNEWTTAISIADKPVGVATIWINPVGSKPDLANFTEGAALAAAFSSIPAEAALVHDTARSAWFTLLGTALVPVVSGESAVTGSTTLDTYQGTLVDQTATAPPTQPSTNQGAINSVLVVAVALLVVVALVVAAGRRSREPADDTPTDESDESADEPDPPR